MAMHNRHDVDAENTYSFNKQNILILSYIRELANCRSPLLCTSSDAPHVSQAIYPAMQNSNWLTEHTNLLRQEFCLVCLPYCP
jgi:hypothetical protein